MSRIDWARWAPPGYDLRREGRLALFGAGFSATFALLAFLPRCYRALSRLYQFNGPKRSLIPGAVMEEFSPLFQGCLWGLSMMALCLPVAVAQRYRYHRQGSRSIYLMRRLPNRWELHRRCMSLPLVALAICPVLALVLRLACFGIYLALTPDGCLPAGGWALFWR